MAGLLPRLQDHLTWLETHKIPSKTPLASTDGRRSFLSPKAVCDHFNRQRIRTILEHVFPQRQDEWGTLAHKIGHGYILVFVILLRMRIPQLEFIESFLRTDALSDDRLPFTTSNGFPPSVDLNEFQRTQQAFCAPTLRPDRELEFDVNRVLPIVQCDLIAEGGSSKVFRCKLHPDFDSLESDTQEVSVVWCGLK